MNNEHLLSEYDILVMELREQIKILEDANTDNLSHIKDLEAEVAILEGDLYAMENELIHVENDLAIALDEIANTRSYNEHNAVP